MEICNQCGNSVAWGSGRYVNRIPSDWGGEQLEQPFPDGEYMCAECWAVECDSCGIRSIEYEFTDDGDALCGKCMEKEAEKLMGS